MKLSREKLAQVPQKKSTELTDWIDAPSWTRILPDGTARGGPCLWGSVCNIISFPITSILRNRELLINDLTTGRMT